MIKEILKATLIQVKADLRPQFKVGGLLSLLFTPILYLGIFWYSSRSGNSFSEFSLGSVLAASLIGGYASFACIQLPQEMYIEHLNGTLLRVKFLPFGIPAWMIGKIVSLSAVTIFQIVSLFVGAAFLPPDFSFSFTQYLLTLLILLIAISANTPIAFLFGTLTRNTYATLIVYAAMIGIFSLSGVVFPITLLPGWLMWVAYITPGYWAAYLTRSIFLDTGARTFFGDSLGYEWLALLLLVAWTILGFTVASFAIWRTFKKETTSVLVSRRHKVDSQLGM
ncbi:ABC transporter permease [Gleimia sp. 6138-11-ORH1]|uniref:ABC transporter permease n=1 Tax=Gleimia sp. 6138-11-ORH1 TaxID=2973937 RepID=UPI00216783FC|nr:ABC transporter permease [Gleimia sp. 6138-11-ORH1]MCS4484158.1 ABC transporter permease [Gleimia sp. 6138-11-ORH1]